MTKVVHVQTGLPASGNAAFRLHQSMLSNGLNSKMLVMTSSKNIDKTISVTPRLKSSIYVRLHNYFSLVINRYKKPSSYSYSYPIRFSHDISFDINVKSADIIYLHWIVGGFLSINSIRRIASLKSVVVIFLHDMWPLTGGCHHSLDCNHYENGCGNCKIFSKDKGYSEFQFDRKKQLYEDFSNIIFVAPSIWMWNTALKSGLTKKSRVFHIPNFVDDKVFCSKEKRGIKELFGISENCKVISFGSNSNSSIYKGWNYLKKALLLIQNSKCDFEIELLVFGEPINRVEIEGVLYKAHCIGRVTDENTLSLVNNASDVFVSPSLAESFGLTFLENLLCGTPVVGFNNTAISEIIDHGINGYLADNQSVEDLANGILFCLNNKLDVKVKEKYRSNSVIFEHMKLIDSVI